jgi:hypothetical protein
MSLIGDAIQYLHWDVESKKGGAVQVTKPLFFAPAQVVDMDQLEMTLILSGTETAVIKKITSNVLIVDCEGTGADLLLPPEADCSGLQLFVVNAGGETIALKNDADGAVLTIATNEHAIVACDGTTWRGFVGVA